MPSSVTELPGVDGVQIKETAVDNVAGIRLTNTHAKPENSNLFY